MNIPLLNLKKSGILMIFFLFGFNISNMDESFAWNLFSSNIGEGIPSFIARVENQENTMELWLEYPCDGPCIPDLSLVLKQGQNIFPKKSKRFETVEHVVLKFPQSTEYRLKAHVANWRIVQLILPIQSHPITRKLFEALDSHESLEVNAIINGLKYKTVFILSNGAYSINKIRGICESTYFKQSKYVFFDSHTRRLNKNDLLHLSDHFLRIARNEIFARHGYIFNSPDLINHFSQLSWYKPTKRKVDLSSIEITNIQLIKSIENQRN